MGASKKTLTWLAQFERPTATNIVSFGCRPWEPVRDIAAMGRQADDGRWSAGTERRRDSCKTCNGRPAANTYCEACGRAGPGYKGPYMIKGANPNLPAPSPAAPPPSLGGPAADPAKPKPTAAGLAGGLGSSPKPKRPEVIHR